jgi:tight adherence protein D
MRKLVCSLISILIITGCVSSQPLIPNASYKNNEAMLISSGNNLELIRLYKQQLALKEDQATRTKLVAAYIEVKDFESALFYISPLLEANPSSARINALDGKAQFGLKAWDKAEIALTKSYQIDQHNGDVLNLLGLISSYKGNYEQARGYFKSARENMYNDVTVKNNLAMIDIIEGKYQAAVEKLTTLSAGENADPKVRSNLALAYAKLGRFEAFQGLLADTKYSEEEQKSIFYQLSTVELRELEGPPDYLAGALESVGNSK